MVPPSPTVTFPSAGRLHLYLWTPGKYLAARTLRAQEACAVLHFSAVGALAGPQLRFPACLPCALDGNVHVVLPLLTTTL